MLHGQQVFCDSDDAYRDGNTSLSVIIRRDIVHLEMVQQVG